MSDSANSAKDSTLAAESSASDSKPAGLARYLRFGGYAGWMALDQAIQLGVPRLIILPALLAVLGVHEFGIFVLALGLINAIGGAPANGLVIYLFRELTHYEGNDRLVAMRTTLLLAISVTLPFFLVLSLGAGWIETSYDKAGMAKYLIPLAIYLLCINVLDAVLAQYRIERKFEAVPLLHGVVSLVALCGVPLCYYFGAVWAGIGFAVGGLLALVIVMIIKGGSLLQAPLWSGTFARAAMKAWAPLSLSSLVTLSAMQLDRLLLGVWWPANDVAIFFAAAGLAQLSGVPATLVSQVVISLLGKVKTIDHFSQRFYLAFAAGAALLSTLMFFVGWPLGGLLLGFFYSAVSEEALPLWGYCLAARMVASAQVSIRPFILKFAPPNIIPVLSAVSFVGRFLPLLLLVPTRGALGAAEGMLIGSIVMAAIWLFPYIRFIVLARPADQLDKP